jgi:chromatin segregation and condensation protein Rec8/ScpA/Scc1 (kleisin family)
MTEILTLLRDTWSMLFSTLAGGERRRADVVTTLLAVLELVRQGRIRAQQTELFGEIVVERQPDPMPLGTRGGPGFIPGPERGGLGGSVSDPPSE